MSKSSSKSNGTFAMLSPEEIKSIHTIGFDLGDVYTKWCAVEGGEGKVVGEGRVRTRAADLQKLLASIGPKRMVIETGTHSPWVSRLMIAAGHETIVANSRQLHVIFKNSKKSDRVDARTLAKVGRCDIELLHPVQHRGEQVQQDMAMLRAREALVKARTQLINHARGSVKAIGERLPKCSSEAFGSKMDAYLPAGLRTALDPVVKHVASLTQQIKSYDRIVVELVLTSYPAAKIMMGVRGIGALTALAFMLKLEDPAYFAKSRNVGAYFGLVPRSAQSGESNPQLRITKQGDEMLRRLMVGAAQYMLGPFGEDCDLRRFGERIAARGGKNAKKRAVIAVARKLAVLLHHLWSTKSIYDPLFNAKRSATKQQAAEAALKPAA